MVKAKVVAVLEIKILDNHSQMIHSNNNHIEVVEETSFKVGGGQRGCGNWNTQQFKSNSKDCHYCGKPSHWVKKCRMKESDMRNGRLQHNNYASSSKQVKDRYEHLFVVQHMLNTMAANVSTNADNVWYVDLGASNCHNPTFGRV
jgi:hypothetical protein